MNNNPKYICKYCGKEFKSIKAVRSHEILCKENPNHKESPFIQYNKSEIKKVLGQSNQYTSAKYNNLPKPQLSEEGKQHISNIWKGKHLPKKIRQKISNSYKKFLDKNLNMVGFIRNHSSQKSYPEKYFENLFEKENIPLLYHKQVGRYELDFYNEHLMKYVEIDGDQHNLPYMIKHDKERDLYLQNLGWIGMRIKWLEYKKLSFEDKQNKINEIRLFINNEIDRGEF